VEGSFEGFLKIQSFDEERVGNFCKKNRIFKRKIEIDLEEYI
jgi:hypothetical protein